MTSILSNPPRIAEQLRTFSLTHQATGTSPGWEKHSAAHWLQVCRSQAFQRGQVKFGELGGGQDTPFEQAFSNLAHAYIKDKAPKLLEFEVGFQLLEKNQDNTKAAGVFGFKVGSQWLYAPVFFLNGDLKGHELLYIKNQDMFVPLKENWINYLLGRKPSVLGEGMNRNLSLIGVFPPNLYQLSRSPYKFAADRSQMRKNFPYKLATWFEDFVPQLSYLVKTPVGTHPNYEGMKTFPDVLKQAGEAGLRYVCEGVGMHYPVVFKAIDDCYGPSMLTGLAQQVKTQKQAEANPSILKEAHTAACRRAAAARRRRMSRRKRASILDEREWSKEGIGVRHEVIDEETVKGHPDVVHKLTEAEREKLLKERVVIRDHRGDDEVTHAYNIQTKLALKNPDATNIYWVMTAPDTFERCLVVFGPYNHKQRNTFCTVIRLDGEKNWMNTHPANVFVRSEIDRDAWTKWLKEQPDADSLPVNNKEDPWRGARYILLGPKGDGTCPFYVREKYEGGNDDSVGYAVNFDSYAEGRRPAYLPDHASMQHDPYLGSDCCFSNSHNENLTLTKLPGVRIRVDMNTGLEVPANFKLITVREARKQIDLSPNEKAEDGPWKRVKYESDPPPIRLASLGNIQQAIINQTRPLKIYSDGKDVTVNENRKDKTAAVVHLVRDWGLREATARELIKRAEQHMGFFECLVEFPKQADESSDMIRGAPNAPPFPEPYMGYDPMTGGNIPTMQESEFNMKIPDMSASKTDRSIYQPTAPDPKTMGIAQQAAQTGQREVFDTAMIGSMLKNTRDDKLIDDNLPDLMKGMDRLGRLLFQFYWHGEEFEDRYGKQDMPELEDGIRNAFEDTGDVALKLRQQSVDPDADSGTDVDLGPVANK